MPFTSEQRAVDQQYARLDTLRAQTRERLARVRQSGPSGSPQNRSERDSFATHYEDRIAQLDAVEERLCFGRLDFDDGTQRYIGRIGLTDAAQHPLLTDWRAPAATPFYQATAASRGDVWRRRHITLERRTVVHVDDDLLDVSASAQREQTVAGQGALMAALNRGRTAHMSDIVATIQAEQDKIIRSEVTGALVVQGGPGTGKTAVALHRAAFLLYTHRERLERSGVLVVGPSTAFLRYIDRVLPSLGETGVVSLTLGELVPGLTATAHDAAAAEEIKGRSLWVRALARAVRARERVPAGPVAFVLDGTPMTIEPAMVAEAMARARRTHKPHNEARSVFVRHVLDALARTYADAQRRAVAPEDLPGIVEDLRTHPAVRKALNLAWFPLSAQRLVSDLWAKPHRLAEAAPELSAAERAALARPAGAPWTPADVVLIDEASELLGEDDTANQARLAAQASERARALDYARDTLDATGAGAGIVSAEVLAERFLSEGPRGTTAEQAAADRRWAYGHVVVDEAQELSHMAWRVLLRRCPTRSFTIVGDVAQTASAAGTHNWVERLHPFFGDNLTITELTVNYRTPRTVAEVADNVGRAAGLPVRETTAARDIADSLQLDIVEADVVTSAVRAGLREYEELEGGGRIAILVADKDLESARAQIDSVQPTLTRGDVELVVSPIRDAKGLEFDVVVLADPRAVSDDGGPADLYVAMTRPTKRLVIVAPEPLPAALDRALADASIGQ